MITELLISFLLSAGSPVEGIPTQALQTHQCEAKTKKGARCKNNALKESKYCQVHKAMDPRVKQCKATTREGKRCSRAATKEGYCTQHYNMHKAGKI